MIFEKENNIKNHNQGSKFISFESFYLNFSLKDEYE